MEVCRGHIQHLDWRGPFDLAIRLRVVCKARVSGYSSKILHEQRFHGFGLLCNRGEYVLLFRRATVAAAGTGAVHQGCHVCRLAFRKLSSWNS